MIRRSAYALFALLQTVCTRTQSPDIANKSAVSIAMERVTVSTAQSVAAAAYVAQSAIDTRHSVDDIV